MSDWVVTKIGIIACKEFAPAFEGGMLAYKGLDIGTDLDRGDAIIR